MAEMLYGDNVTLMTARMRYRRALKEAGLPIPEPCCDDDALCYTNTLLEAYEEIPGNGRP
jgi:hypothetical protein